MFGIEKEMVSRKCVIALEGGYKVVATLTMPKPTKPIFPDEMERKMVEEFNKSQPHIVHKAVRVHILRN